jgi:hypothetical protein
MKRCSYCGRENKDEVVRCSECGTNFYVPEGEPLAVQLDRLLCAFFAACRSPRNMTARQVKGLAVFVLGLICLLALILKLASPFESPLPIYGRLEPEDVRVIKRAARQQIFTNTKPSVPAWLPVLVQKIVWLRIAKAISDRRHPILRIHVVATNSVQVCYRVNPKQLSYVGLIRSSNRWEFPTFGPDQQRAARLEMRRRFAETEEKLQQLRQRMASRMEKPEEASKK